MSERDITVTLESGRWWWKRTFQRTFHGSGTVWHDVETGARPGTDLESRLSEIAWLDEQKERTNAVV